MIEQERTIEEKYPLSEEEKAYYDSVAQRPWTTEQAFMVRDGFGVEFVKRCGYNFEPVITEFGEEWYNISSVDAVLQRNK